MILSFKKQFQEPKNLFAKILPWAYISDYSEGVVVQKSGLLQKTFAFRGPDLEAASPVYFNDMCVFLNDIVKRLGNGWALQFEVQRYMVRDYPGCDFDNFAAYLVDKEREQHYQSYGIHFDSSYYMTIVYEPELEVTNKIVNIFFQSSGFSSSVQEAVGILLQTTNDIYELLSKRMDIFPLNNQQTLEYLHSSVSRQQHPIFYPEKGERIPPFLLDKILPDTPLDVGMTMKLGEEYIPILGITGFPSKTYPAILDALNAAGVEYRWTSRFICKDKTDALKDIEKQSNRYFGARKSWKQTFFNMMNGEETGKTNKAAEVLGDDTDAAGIDVETDVVSIGLYSSSIVTWDKNLKVAKNKLTYLKGIIQAAGITCKEETFNALESFLSMMPGNVFANIRRYDLTSLNFAHLIPCSAIWAGELTNQTTEKWVGVNSPLVVCSTGYGTPFFLNANVDDVGNVMIVGPVGSGKSTLLQLLEIQFLKYKACQVVIFDKGRSARQLTMAVGGRYYEPGTSRIAFQPLESLETYENCLWACEFIEGLLILQHLTIIPAISKAIYDAIELMKDLEKRQRTLTTFRQMVNYLDSQTAQPVIRQALDPYCLGGKYGSIFDASETSISTSKWMMFEMEELMRLGDACATPALSYLFHFVEKLFSDNLITLLVLDEAFLFFKNKIFADRFHEWLKTLRKKKVWIIFATQEVADFVNSSLCSTITQQCQTKIFLADKEATTPALADYYKTLGLTNSEIDMLSHATPKRDYYYKSQKGCRLFQLDLGQVTLGFIGSQNHDLLDSLEEQHGSNEGYEYAEEILTSKNIEYKHLLKDAV